VGEASSSGMGRPFRSGRGRTRARRIHRARHDPRRPLRLLPDIPPFGIRSDAVRHARQRVGDAPRRVQAVPCCHYNHAYLDCALALRREHGIEPDAIAAIECRVAAGELPIVCEPRESKLRPRITYDAQFSLAYSVAAALIDGRVGLDTYTKDRIRDERTPSRLPPGSSTPWTPPRASPTGFRDGSGFASATAGWSRHGSPTGAGAQSDRWSPRRSSPSSATTPGGRSRLTTWR
jgi:hypothetical protein